MDKISYMSKLKRVKILNAHDAIFQKEISSINGFFHRNKPGHLSKVAFRVFPSDKNLWSDTEKKSFLSGLFFYMLMDVFLSKVDGYMGSQKPYYPKFGS